MLNAVSLPPRVVGHGQKSPPRRTEDRPRSAETPRSTSQGTDSVGDRRRAGNRRVGFRQTLLRRGRIDPGRNHHRPRCVGRRPRRERARRDRLRRGAAPGDGQFQDYRQGARSAGRGGHVRRSGPVAGRAGRQPAAGPVGLGGVPAGRGGDGPGRDQDVDPASRTGSRTHDEPRRAATGQPGEPGPRPHRVGRAWWHA